MLDVLMSLPETDPKFFEELLENPWKTLAYNPKHGHAVSALSAALQNAHKEPPFHILDDDNENIPTTDTIDHMEGTLLTIYKEQGGYLVTATF